MRYITDSESFFSEQAQRNLSRNNSEHMVNIRKIGIYALLLSGVLLIIITLSSLFYDSSFWFLRILNFPRLLVLIALAICLIIHLFFHEKRLLTSVLFLVGLAVCIGIQCFKLYPYMPFAQKKVASVTAASTDKKSVVDILVANVLMTNRQADALLTIISDKDPAIVLTMEVNTWWVNQLKVLEKRYPYRIIVPTNNTYGMAMYSKFPLKNQRTLQLNHEHVPSFYTTVTLPNGQLFQLLTIHPVAPKPSEHPDNIGEKEVALPKAARLIARQPLPAIVAGDFNDVGWSYNTQQFEEISKLEDVRYGRGMYNSFDAQSLFLRWPLDYVYVSNEFRLVDIERLPAFGSDHFPLYVRVALQP